MKILAIGDIVGKSGLEYLKSKIIKIKEESNIDFVIVNGENAADGFGVTEKMFKELVNMGIDVITMGNHTWGKKDIFSIIDDTHIIRPANYSENVPGNGYNIYNFNGKKILVMNLIGRVDMPVLSENPFIVAKKIVDTQKSKVDIIIIDFHGEATAEKKAFGYYLDGDVTIVFGTHTHVQTADEQILPNGTAYITDIGMTGPKNSVIGMDIDVSLKRFLTSIPEKYKTASGTCKIDAIIFDLDDNTNKVKSMKRVSY